MPFTIVRQDITKMDVDAVVTAANPELRAGGGVCGAIFAAAGAKELQAACNALAPIELGSAAITPGFKLPARYVIHAAGPVYGRQSTAKSEQLLRRSYTSALALALENHCESIAFPLISSGTYGYPKAEALAVATSAIREFIAEHDIDVYLAVFDRDAFELSEDLLGAVESYIDENYVAEHEHMRGRVSRLGRLRADADEPRVYEDASIAPMELFSCEVTSSAPRPNLEDVIGKLDEPFNATLLRLIDAKGMSDVEVYKRANISRKLFSKIRGGDGYMPSKRTIIALAIALELTLDETGDLLERAGYALSHSVVFDVIVEFFIGAGRYDIFEINEVLFSYDQPLLGAR